MSKKLGLGALIGIMFLVGCTNRQPVPEAMQAPETIQNVGEANTPLINENKEMIDEERAKAIALEQVSNGIVVEVSHDLNELRPNYEFTIQEENYEYEIEVDAYTGMIIKMDKDFKISDSLADNTKEITIDEVKAKEIALAEVPNGIVTKTSFDGDEYIPNYEIDVAAEGYEYEFEIDARDGTILKMKKNLID